MYTPINKYRLTRKGRAVMEDIDKVIAWSSVQNIPVSIEDFELLLMSISPRERHSYQDMIPYENRKILRG